MNLECVDHLEHEEEGRGRTIGLPVFLLGKLPVGHDIPDDLTLVEGRLLQLLVLEVYDLKEPEHLRPDTLVVYAELVYHPGLDVRKAIV